MKITEYQSVYISRNYSSTGSVYLYNRLIESSEQLCMDKTDPWTFALVQYGVEYFIISAEQSSSFFLSNMKVKGLYNSWIFCRILKSE